VKVAGIKTFKEYRTKYKKLGLSSDPSCFNFMKKSKQSANKGTAFLNIKKQRIGEKLVDGFIFI